MKKKREENKNAKSRARQARRQVKSGGRKARYEEKSQSIAMGKNSDCKLSNAKKLEMNDKRDKVPGLKQQASSGKEPRTTKSNSTVFHNKDLAPVIIDFSREKMAIRACDLLRIFNN